MAFEDVSHEGHAIKELQGFTVSVAAGAAAATNIPVTGITTNDTLAGVLMFAAGVPSDVTSEASITSDGNIQLSTTDSTGNQLVVMWFKKQRP